MVDSDIRERAKLFVMEHGLNPDFLVSIVAHFAAKEVAKIQLQYGELLFAVEDKFPGETRHQTALRFIRERQRREMQAAMTVVNAEEK
jgi:hypothetical protein